MTPSSLRRRALLVSLAALLCVPTSGAVAAPSPAPSAAPSPPPSAALEEARLTADPGQQAARPVAGYRPVRSITLPVAGRRLVGGWRVQGWRTNGFAQVGATWRGGDPVLQARSRAQGARWGAWQELEALHDGPDRRTDEGRSGLDATDLWWAGDARDVQVRARGTGYRQLKVVLIDPGAAPSDAASPRSAPSVSRSARSARGEERPERAPRPRIRGRRAWDANEAWRENPRYNRALKAVHVHHTVNSNDYGRRDVPGLIRGIYRYHTKSLGWSDVGYNFLVDRFGRIWAGRAGGPRRKVRGAHTLGFNHNSTGVSVIGNFETVRPRKSVRVAIAKLASWKLDRLGHSPRQRVRMRSEGSDRYGYGARPRLRRISGHRDTNYTACPGAYLYSRLPGIRRRAQIRANYFS